MSLNDNSDSNANRKKDEQNFTEKEKIEDRQHRAYIMDLQGFSNKEISEKLVVSPSTVEKDLHEMKTECKKRLKILDEMGYKFAFLKTNDTLEVIQKEGWKLFRTEENGKIKANLLKTISETAIRQVELLKHVPLPPMTDAERMAYRLKQHKEAGWL